MSDEPNYQKFAILFIDDEQQSQKYFSQIFGETFRIKVASDGEEGLELFRKYQDEIGIVVSDQRMPRMTGSALLREVAKIKPEVVNILSTAYSDLDAAIDAVNDGGIYRYVTKPWDLPELDVTLRRAMDYFMLRDQHQQLTSQKLLGLEQIFHQSRLLACAAVPALLETAPSAVRAIRDLLRLSLSEDPLQGGDARPVHLDLDSLDRKQSEQQIAAAMKEIVSQRTEKMTQGKAALKVALENLLKASSSPGPLPQALAGLLNDQATPENLEHLATLLASYESQLEITWSDGVAIVQESTEDHSSTTFHELCRLFIDDSFLVSCILGELPHRS